MDILVATQRNTFELMALQYSLNMRELGTDSENIRQM